MSGRAFLSGVPVGLPTAWTNPTRLDQVSGHIGRPWRADCLTPGEHHHPTSGGLS